VSDGCVGSAGSPPLADARPGANAALLSAAAGALAETDGDTERDAPLRIVCLGSRWHGDDGLGCHVFEYLHDRPRQTAGAKVVDAGIAGLNAVPAFEHCDKAVVVDALRVGARVGTVHRLRPTDLRLASGALSLHVIGVSELLAALPIVFGHRAMPEIVVIGAQIGAIRPFTDELTPRVRKALPRVIDLVCRECTSALTGVRRDAHA